MTPDQLAQVHAAANDASGAWSVKDFTELLSSPLVFALGDPNCFCLARVVADEAEILTIATHPDHQRQGHARRVLADFEATAQSKGATLAFLEVGEDNTAACALYEGCGYQAVGTRTAYYTRANGQKVDALLMSKALTKG